LSVSISTMRFIRSNDTTMPSGRGMQPPDMPVPAPRAVTGTRRSSARRSSAATSSVVAGDTTAKGSCAVAVSASSCP
jgi:hypothetical protein